MSTVTGPADMAGALAMVQAGMRFLAEMDKADLPCPALGELLVTLEQTDAVQAAVRGETMAVFDAQDGSVT